MQCSVCGKSILEGMSSCVSCGAPAPSGPPKVDAYAATSFIPSGMAQPAQAASMTSRNATAPIPAMATAPTVGVPVVPPPTMRSANPETGRQHVIAPQPHYVVTPGAPTPSVAATLPSSPAPAQPSGTRPSGYAGTPQPMPAYAPPPQPVSYGAAPYGGVPQQQAMVPAAQPPPPLTAGYGAYQVAYGAQMQQTGTSGMAIASLVCGLLGLTPLWVGFILCIIAIALGIAAVTQIRPGQGGKGMAIAGIILGAVFIIPAGCGL